MEIILFTLSLTAIVLDFTGALKNGQYNPYFYMQTWVLCEYE